VCLCPVDTTYPPVGGGISIDSYLPVNEASQKLWERQQLLRSHRSLDVREGQVVAESTRLVCKLTVISREEQKPTKQPHSVGLILSIIGIPVSHWAALLYLIHFSADNPLYLLSKLKAENEGVCYGRKVCYY
jgi:hypothetical protein